MECCLKSNGAYGWINDHTYEWFYVSVSLKDETDSWDNVGHLTHLGFRIPTKAKLKDAVVEGRKDENDEGITQRRRMVTA
ncbi:hypothetical protein KIN20_018642 [Parelaphostrongylus tenuis]|uniref:Uncharacterized protein n=1 Tax=Parelaphostrongylus tenuis TaxID=148309 RepID=A0AAD5QSB6_PARTN|nr:hypothetical protein KIN20_018642 [Parelaphostrongylus tenuis]